MKDDQFTTRYQLINEASFRQIMVYTEKKTKIHRTKIIENQYFHHSVQHLTLDRIQYQGDRNRNETI